MFVVTRRQISLAGFVAAGEDFVDFGDLSGQGDRIGLHLARLEYDLAGIRQIHRRDGTKNAIFVNCVNGVHKIILSLSVSGCNPEYRWRCRIQLAHALAQGNVGDESVTDRVVSRSAKGFASHNWPL